MPDNGPMVGSWRDIVTGVDPMFHDPEWNDGANDQPGTPAEPIYTRIEGGSAMVMPWWDALEDPAYPMGLGFIESPNPTYPDESVGGLPIVGAYDGAYRSRGPVYQWGHEVSGGLGGDQAIGRIQRFPANIPDRYDPNGIKVIDYRDELAAALEMNGQGDVSDTEVTSNLILYPNYGGS